MTKLNIPIPNFKKMLHKEVLNSLNPTFSHFHILLINQNIENYILGTFMYKYWRIMEYVQDKMLAEVQEFCQFFLQFTTLHQVALH